MERAAVTERDLQTMLHIVREPEPDDPGEPLSVSVLAGLYRLIPCDQVTFFLLDAETFAEHSLFGVRLFQEFPPSDPMPAEQMEAFADAFRTHYWDSLDCSYPDRTGDLASITKFSDFYSDRAARKHGMWVDYLEPLGMVREIKMCLPSSLRRTVRVMLHRGPGADFSERDRALLALLRPHLGAHFRQWQERRAMANLTDRQRELLMLVKQGHTNAQIARKLFLTEATVRTHLENIYGRLGVTNRVAAINKAFPGIVDPVTLPTS